MPKNISESGMSLAVLFGQSAFCAYKEAIDDLGIVFAFHMRSFTMGVKYSPGVGRFKHNELSLLFAGTILMK